MLIIKYLYDTKFVYRDLKPNNVIVDYNNKIAFLIDFDRMININSQKRENENEFTKNFPLGFVAPEVLYGDITYKNDIYSLGRMIEYLQLEKENDEMFSLYQKCVNNQPNKRPFFYQLIELFYSIFFQFIDETFVIYFPEIQYLKGVIYYRGKQIKRDINKSIHFLSLSANQNRPDAQYMLGAIYYEGKYIERDVNKSIHYLSLSANQNNINAQHMLSLIYLEGKYINQDINKSIHYYSLAANQNDPHAQYALGVFYFMGIYFKKNIIKAIDYFIQSSSNGFIEGHFAVGYFYHEGKHVKRDIKKSIHHYKEASTFNNQYAKNNLGVIYRYGCGDEIQPNCGLSMDYFEEAIRRFKDKVSMYNLAHIYIYEDKNKSRLKKSIEFLIESNKQNFSPSTELLCIALIKLFGFSIEIILEELNKLTEKSKKLPNLIYNMIIDKKLLYEPNYENYYQSLSTVNYLYYFNNEIISTELFNRKEPVLKTKKTGKNITQEFYDGFGIHDHC